ncbi:phage major capsid protein [Mycobacterium intracellulare]|uniref:phage major capsid protein n=1 Tax=Mycobacterium intracellulare TaxID=1767 RepID=UPI003557140C
MYTKDFDDLRRQIAQDRDAAQEILTRAEGDLNGADADEFDRLIQRAQANKERLDGYQRRVDAVASFEAITSAAPDPAAPNHPQHGALHGQQFLTRADSVSQWAGDNGFDNTTERPSFDRYLRGIVTGNWRGADQERALAEGTQSAGGYLVPTPLASFVIDIARNATRVVQAGGTTVPMQSQTLRVPRLINEGAPAWRNENAQITEQDLQFDSVLFTAKSLDRLVTISRELFEDSNPDASGVIANSFGRQIAVALDYAALRGSGVAPVPLGVLNTPNVIQITNGANGSAITNYDFLLDAVNAVRSNNFEPNAHIVAPRTVNSLRKLKDSQNRYLQPPADSLPLLATNQIPVNLTVGTSSDASEVYTGQWDQLAIGIRTEFVLEFLRERFADYGQYGFIGHLRADVQLLQPAAFAVDTGIRG